MTTISKKEVHKFLDKHPDIPFSAAKFEYSLYLEPEAVEYANAISEKMLDESEEDLHSKRMIEQAETTEELLKLMRKPLSGGNRSRLRGKLLEYETVMMPCIKEKTMKNGQDIFIENTLYFFLHCEENCCDWLMKEYSNIRNEYLKSMLCLVIGFRGDVEMIPFLMKETERLERMYPQETYAQGPILAIQENLLSDFLVEIYEGGEE